jgi:hypothetical protein
VHDLSFAGAFAPDKGCGDACRQIDAAQLVGQAYGTNRGSPLAWPINPATPLSPWITSSNAGRSLLGPSLL